MENMLDVTDPFIQEESHLYYNDASCDKKLLWISEHFSEIQSTISLLKVSL